MRKYQQLERIAAEHNGVLATANALAAGVSKDTFKSFITENQYERVCHGIYLAPNAWRDEVYLTQLRCPQVVYSHDSALFYHDLTDREPLQLTVTAKTGYNPTHLTTDGVKVYTVKEELYNLGITEAVTPFGNTIRVYDMDRTICDIVRSRNAMETQVYNEAWKQYARRKDKNLHRLMDYAEKFHVAKIVRKYMGILL